MLHRLADFLGNLVRPLLALRHRRHGSVSDSGLTYRLHRPYRLEPQSIKGLAYQIASSHRSTYLVREY
jgi:hypothetical protein